MNTAANRVPMNHTGRNSMKLHKGKVVKVYANSAAMQLHLLELEELNTGLHKLIDEQAVKLAEVVATNAKFLSIIAHDLRSPFGSIIGVLELLKESYDDLNLKDVEKYISMASNSTYGTLNLLDNLLAWIAAQNKATYFNPVRINLYELVMNELESVSTSAIHKKLTLRHFIPEKLYLTADLQMTKTILRNLVNNAIKFSYIGGIIKVSAVKTDQIVEITVQDNGIGITQKAQKELFKANEMHSTRGTDNENGTGLGLLLCKEFVVKHGGNITIESEQGKGTKIKFTMPNSV